MHPINELRSKGEASRYIESCWKTESNITLPPDGTFNLVWASDDLTVQVGNHWKDFQKGIYLMPVQNKVISFSSSSSVCGVRLKAFALKSILKDKCNQLESVNKLSDLLPENTILKEKLWGNSKESSLEELLLSMENLVMELIGSNSGMDQSFRDKVNYILDRRGVLKISELQSVFGISRQGLHKAFVQKLGMSAKELSKIWRLNYFLTLIQEEMSLTSAALEAGYYDQAHGIKDFKNHFGFTPQRIRKDENTSLNYSLACMNKRFNNYYDPQLE